MFKIIGWKVRILKFHSYNPVLGFNSFSSCQKKGGGGQGGGEGGREQTKEIQIAVKGGNLNLIFVI